MKCKTADKLRHCSELYWAVLCHMPITRVYDNDELLHALDALGCSHGASLEGPVVDNYLVAAEIAESLAYGGYDIP